MDTTDAPRDFETVKRMIEAARALSVVRHEPAVRDMHERLYFGWGPYPVRAGPEPLGPVDGVDVFTGRGL